METERSSGPTRTNLERYITVDSPSPSPSPQPLRIPHIIQRVLAYTDQRTLARCLQVHSEWYDAATAELWRHVSYRLNRFLSDPGARPFLPVDSSVCSATRTTGTTGNGDADADADAHARDTPSRMDRLRWVKRRAMRHVQVLEVRTHDCEVLECGRMTTHEEDEVGDGDGQDGGPLSRSSGASDGPASVVAVGSAAEPTASTTAASGRAFSLNEANSSSGRSWISSTSATITGTEHPRTTLPARFSCSIHLRALRLHIDQIHRPRPIPFPCPFISLLDTRTIVLLPISHFSHTRPLPIPSPPSLRKLVILLIPHGQAPPAECRLADTIPGGVVEIVVVLWRRFHKAPYDHFGGAWAEHMRRKGFGPEKVLGHWANFVLACREKQVGQGGHKRRFTFVGTGWMDPAWMGMTHALGLVDGASDDEKTPEEARETYGLIQGQVERVVKECLESKLKDRARSAGEGWRDNVSLGLRECLDSVRFVSREEYLQEGGWEGEFTLDEVMYHG